MLRINLYIISRIKLIRGIFLAVTVASYISGILKVYTTTDTPDLLELSMHFIFAPLIILVFFGGLPSFFLIAIYTFKPIIFKGNIYKLTDWGMEITTSKTAIILNWSEFNGYKETNKFIYLFLDKDCHIIQKRLLKNPEELDWIKTVLSDKLS